MRTQMSAGTQSLILPTEMYELRNLSDFPGSADRRAAFGEGINEMTKWRGKCESLLSQTRPTVPSKKAWGQTAGQMLGLKLASCFSTTNSDVTLGAFSEWFKYLRPHSAAEGMLNQPAIRPEGLFKPKIYQNQETLHFYHSQLKLLSPSLSLSLPLPLPLPPSLLILWL